jgi:hypothetical protein
MGDYSTLFRELYAPLWPPFEQYLREKPELSPPLLINPLDDYANQLLRLFVIGQETRTWYNDVMEKYTGIDVMNELMDVYKNKFRLGLCKRRRSAFLGFLRALERRLGIKAGAVVWSNINKVDQKGRRPSEEVQEKVHQLFPVLAEEIRIARADSVVFLTGHGYDHRIHSLFPGARFTCDEELGSLLSSVSHDSLPSKTYRTNHPHWLLRSRGNWWRRVLNRLTVLITAPMQ